MSFLARGNLLACRLRQAWLDRSTRARVAGAWRDPAVASGGAPRVLVAAFGLIGDAILATAGWRQLRSMLPGRELVLLGREAILPVAAPHFDRVVAFTPQSWPAAAAGLGGPFEAILGDLHVFNGGLALLEPVFTRLAATKRLLYEGYAPRTVLAPGRRFPAGCEIVPMRAGGGHVLEHERHYLAAVGKTLGARAPAEPFAPTLEPGDVAGLLAQHRLTPGGYVACQLTSSRPRKAYPLARFAEVVRKRPETVFVALGTAAERDAVAALGLDQLVNLCGQAPLPAAFGVIAQARAFLGLDSGLAHAAAALGVPTVVVTPNNTLGAFWPWPAENLRAPGVVVHDVEHQACTGRFFACPDEPIWELARRGPRCLRAIPATEVAAALGGVLAAAGRG